MRSTIVLVLVIVLLSVLGGALLIGCGAQPTPTPTPATPTPTLIPPTPTPIPSTPTPAPTATEPSAVSQLNCQECHNDTHTQWSSSSHADTQTDVAGELSEERLGQSLDEVIHGQDAEDCIACHGPTSITANGGMTEVQALGYFFTTTDGKFTKDTAVAHAADWPSVTCTTCHNVPTEHNASPDQRAGMTTLALFNSPTGKYAPVDSVSKLCGQCHGNLRFDDTDHLTYNAWTTSKHSDTQADVANELGEERAGQTPDEVVNGDDPENCIACHAPTAVLGEGGMSETQALDYFFTTTNGKFAADTAPAYTSEWPNVTCIACHDQHNPGKPSYFNSATGEHELMKDASELCGQCHGNLRFPDTDHLSYNIWRGAGAADQQTMPGVACTDCHMFASDVDGSNSAMFHGHTWAITVKEADGKSTTSCTQCHADQDTAKANTIIDEWKSEFRTLDAAVQKNVEAAVKAMQGSEDQALQAKLQEAQHNLEYAESDESGGFHNHSYLMSLLKDANDKTQEVLSALGK